MHHRRRADVCFGPEPDAKLDLTPDVVAYATGDVETAPGDEIVLLTARGAFAWRTGADEDAWPRKLVDANLLWQIPDPREAFHWQAGVRDVNGDGLDDLVLPEPGGYRIAVQSRSGKGESSFDRVYSVALPGFAGDDPRGEGAARMQAREQGRRLQISLRIGGDEEETDTGISVADIVPYPVFADWNGDKRLDLLAQQGDELLVWRQHPTGGFGTAPSHRLLFPVEMDRGRRLDLAYSAHVADLNGDGKTDCVVLAGDRKSEDPRTQVLVYLQGVGRGRAAKTSAAPLFGPRGIPQQLLLVGGFAGAPQITDVDGDGAPDLVVGRIDVDPVDAIRAATSGKLSADLYIYLNRRGRFSKVPDSTHTIDLPVKNLPRSGGDLVSRFIGDVTGDGTSDLLLRDEEERLKVLALRRGRDGLSFHSRPVFETRIEKRSRLVVSEPGPGRRPEILVVHGREALHVRFAR